MGRTPNLNLLWKVTDSWRLKDRCARGHEKNVGGALRLRSVSLEAMATHIQSVIPNLFRDLQLLISRDAETSSA